MNVAQKQLVLSFRLSKACSKYSWNNADSRWAGRGQASTAQEVAKHNILKWMSQMKRETPSVVKARRRLNRQPRKTATKLPFLEYNHAIMQSYTSRVISELSKVPYVHCPLIVATQCAPACE